MAEHKDTQHTLPVEPQTKNVTTPQHTRREFIRRQSRKAAYVAPLVVTLAATRTARGASGYGPSGG